MSTDDDEAFARMLQQQLLDEERMLMEQEQEQQRMAEGQQTYPSESASSEFNSQEYLQNLRQQGLDKPPEEPEERVRAAAPPTGYRIGGGSLQFPPARAQHSTNDEYLDSDAELARRLQEMESMGLEEEINRTLGETTTHSTATSNGDGTQMPIQSASLDARRQEQEEEDARLARLLAETGGSFRDLKLPGSVPAEDIPEIPSASSFTPEFTPYIENMPSCESYGSDGGNAAQFSSSPRSAENSRELKPQPSGPGPTHDFQPSTTFSSNIRERKAPPPGPSQFQDIKPPPQSNPLYPQTGEQEVPPVPSRTNSVASDYTAVIRNTTAKDRLPNSRIVNTNTNDYDPSPLDTGPLQEVGYHTQFNKGSPSRPGTKLQSINDNKAADYSDSMLPGDAFLDVPMPGKKDKKKKGLMTKIFRGRTNNNEKGEETSPQHSKEEKRGLFGRPRANPGPGEAMRRTTPATNTSNNAHDRNDEMVVKYPIPEPVPRPPDTIGAPKGPLPYSVSVSKRAPELPEVTIGKKPPISLSMNTATCAVCFQIVQKPINALDKKFHTDCFRCVTCHQIIDPNSAFAFVENDGDKQPMHRKCNAEIFGIKCCVCEQSIPSGSDGKFSFVKHPFFDTEQMCPRHARNMTRRCTGCHRFEPENHPFADLNDVGRCVCMACCRSVVVDSQDAQPLWTKVVEFFEKKLNLPIWKDFREVPILIVGYNALNDQMNNTSNVHTGVSQIMTRGLCLTEHESGRRFRMNRMKYDSSQQSFVANDVEERGFTFFQVPDANKVNPDASVTAILCLSGLPRDLAASVLAHEACHAWIKLHPRFDFEKPIPPQVEEGCAQLIAHLFLNEGLEPAKPLENNDGSGPSDEKLRQYFRFSIETDDHDIYGTGYRRAAKAYSHIGIEALMSHVVLYQEFPEV